MALKDGKDWHSFTGVSSSFHRAGTATHSWVSSAYIMIMDTVFDKYTAEFVSVYTGVY